MNKKTTLYTITAILIVAVVAGLVIWRIGQKAEQPILPEVEQIITDGVDPNTLIQGEGLGEFGELLGEMDFGGLNAELQEVDGLVEQLQP